MSLTPQDVEELLAVLDSADVDELHLRLPRMEITLRRGSRGLWRQSPRITAAPTLIDPPGHHPAAEPSAGPGHDPGGDPGHARDGTADGTVAVLAPLAGTFYRAPAPGAAPFVEIGDRVDAASVIGIVETMKLMNSVPAGTPGVVVEIRPADAGPVGRGAVLVLLRPDPTDASA
jgi:acetyl-CoA carboxylase biotin carboxyl carrier protein